jgi:peptidoglycan hydrolase-like protein with peptidoglycan-binding domain
MKRSQSHTEEGYVKKLAIATIAAVSLLAGATLPAAAQQPSQGQQNLDMDAVPNLDQEGIKKVQDALNKKGFDSGPVDGVVGPKTREAVRRFQDSYGIKASGQIDNQTLYGLGQYALAGPNKS